MTVYRFRSSVTAALPADKPPTIDRRAGVVRGVSLAEGVEALGHGMDLDATTLAQVADAVNSAGATGIKVRLGHPGACENTTGKMLGRVRDARVDGNRVLADFQLSQSARTMPGVGDAHSWFLSRAAEDPSSFGFSIAFTGDRVWPLSDGSEVAALDDNGDAIKKPATATTVRPVARLSKLHAADIVEDPAANRAGLFSSLLSGSSAGLADEAFAQIDAFLAENGISREVLPGFVARYFAAHGLNSDKNQPEIPAEKPETDMDAKQFAAFVATHKDHAPMLAAMYGEGKTESDMLAAIEKANIATLSAKMSDLLAKAEKERADHAAALQASKDQLEKAQAELAAASAKIAELEKFKALGKGAPAPIGGDPTDELGNVDDQEKLWATDPKLRATFFGDKEAFLALGKLKFEQVSDEKRGPVSLTPKGGTTIDPINHKNIDKKEG